MLQKILKVMEINSNREHCSQGRKAGWRAIHIFTPSHMCTEALHTLRSQLAFCVSCICNCSCILAIFICCLCLAILQQTGCRLLMAAKSNVEKPGQHQHTHTNTQPNTYTYKCIQYFETVFPSALRIATYRVWHRSWHLLNGECKCCGSSYHMNLKMWAYECASHESECLFRRFKQPLECVASLNICLLVKQHLCTKHVPQLAYNNIYITFFLSAFLKWCPINID